MMLYLSPRWQEPESTAPAHAQAESLATHAVLARPEGFSRRWKSRIDAGECGLMWHEPVSVHTASAPPPFGPRRRW